jgi:SAM-dependent methyltransferase
MTATRDAAALYDGLARYHWLCRRLRLCPLGSGLEMHKRLAAAPPGRDGPPAGHALHDWLWARAALHGTPRVLEIGCGFGATTLHWARTREGEFVGVGDSGFQITRARAQAARLPLRGRCQFVQQDYDQRVAGPFDAVFAVEALLHARDLTRTLRNLAASLAPQGRLVAQEDVARAELPPDDSDACALRTAWATAQVWTIADWEAAARHAGLQCLAVHELTAQVVPRPEPVLRRAQARLRLLRKVVCGRRARAAVDAFLGGIALERLYRKGLLTYRCMVFARVPAPAVTA